MVDFWEIISAIGKILLEILKLTWWIILPALLFSVFSDFWNAGIRGMYIKKMKWIFLEIKIPGNVLKTPKAMENIFTALHSIYNSDPGWEDVHFNGKVLSWYSFEMVGYAGGVSFYVRAPESTRNLIESAVYSEYPDAEIVLADDYVNFMPSVLPNDIYDIWGSDYILANKNPYPIQTYPYFEANIEEQRLDPISAITEVMSKLKEGEAIWLQYLMRPVGDKWKKEGEEIRDKMYSRKKPDAPPSFLMGIIYGFFEFLLNLIKGIMEPPTWADGKKPSDDKGKVVTLSPGERNVLEAIENKISKFGFETAIRFIYIDKKDEFTQLNVAAVSGAFKQFGTQDRNSFKMISETKTSVTGDLLTTKSWFRKNKIYARKRSIYDAYRSRKFPPKCSILCTEELATVFHFPLSTVGAPMLRRLETRKGEPPSNLPM
jgi:hypothetical protein